MNTDTRKCRYKFCSHSTRDVPVSEAVKEKTSYYHADCYQTKEDIKEIIRLFTEHIDPLWWRDKDGDKVQKDGLKCGNYALTVDLNRLGEQMSEDEYIDFMFDGSKMRISEAQQHITKRTPFE